MKGWYHLDISSHRFDWEEFKVWCEYYLLDDNTEVNPESGVARDALFWTGGVPHELDLLWKQPAEGLIEKTALYRRQRFEEMTQSHGKFCVTLVDRKMDNLAECVSRMALGLSPPNSRLGMDQQLFEIIKEDNGGSEMIAALNPVARGVLILFHGQHIMTPLGLVADLVLGRNEYTNDTKGRIIEKYITTMMELSKRFSFTSRRTTKKGLLTVTSARKVVEIEDVIHFSGNKLPLRNSFDRRATTLFVPRSPNYPGFDFFIWNFPEELLMAFQVTVKQPFTSHPQIEGTGENCKLWLDFCYDVSGQKPMEIYWIMPRSCVGKPKSFQDHVVLFDELYENLPALKKLTLQ